MSVRRRTFAGLGPRGWRTTRWTIAVALLALPAIAMQFTREVDWSAGDFLFMGVLLASVVGLYELATRNSDPVFRIGVALAVLTAFLIIWINLAVGIAESNVGVFFIPPLIALAGSMIAHFRPRGMAAAMTCAAIAHLPAAIVVDPKPGTWPLNLIFAAMWIGAAWLFRRAGTEPVEPQSEA